MPEEHVTIRYPDGYDLGQSHRSPGAESPNLFDADGHLGGQVEIYRDADESVDESDPGLTDLQKMVLTVVAGVTAGIITYAVAPVVKERWSRFLAERRQTRKLPKAADQPSPIDLAELEQVETAQPGSQLEEAPVRMTSAEWQEGFQAMLIAGGFSAAQWGLLSSAIIEDQDEEGLALRAQSEMQKLTPQQGMGSIAEVFETNPKLREDGSLLEVSKNPERISAL